MNERVRDLIRFIYGREDADGIVARLERLIEERFADLAPPSAAQVASGKLPLDERDAFLITYGDQFRRADAMPLETLGEFSAQHLSGIVSGIHILPFFPYTSDDGFSISDYDSVDSELGTWSQVEHLAASFKLMSDLVLNHCSVSHRWFKGFLDDEPRYREYFITASPDDDLSMVARPRALPLLTKFETKAGVRHVWTTFSTDQVDLNYANPEVLIEMISIFFDHVRHGIQVIRLDAIAYLWKEMGNSCIHHPKTHAVVKLFRALAEEYAPWVVIITETNVPHEENISYFGSGDDEAHMIYQFSLPPLVLDAFLREDTRHLSAWAASLPPLTGPTTYFNFLASHDGVGLLPAHGILTEEEIDGLRQSVLNRGGLISYKATATGEIPYEMNINYCDAVAERELGDELRARKFLASQAFLLSLVGVPGIYVHSLLGSGNFTAGVRQTGRNRTINREKLSYRELEAELGREGSFRSRVLRGYAAMLRARRRSAFHPLGGQRVLPTEKAVFAVLRESPAGDDRVVCAINTAHAPARLVLGSEVLPARGKAREGGFRELISGQPVDAVRDGESWAVPLEPWQVAWIAASAGTGA